VDPREQGLQYPLDRTLGEPQNRSEQREEKNVCPYRDLNPDPVTSLYTDCTLPTLNITREVTVIIIILIIIITPWP
jgi:hypothetical protein